MNRQISSDTFDLILSRGTKNGKIVEFTKEQFLGALEDAIEEIKKKIT